MMEWTVLWEMFKACSLAYKPNVDWNFSTTLSLICLHCFLVFIFLVFLGMFGLYDVVCSWMFSNKPLQIPHTLDTSCLNSYFQVRGNSTQWIPTPWVVSHSAAKQITISIFGHPQPAFFSVLLLKKWLFIYKYALSAWDWSKIFSLCSQPWPMNIILSVLVFYICSL